jgi:hypothetical protein
VPHADALFPSLGKYQQSPLRTYIGAVLLVCEFLEIPSVRYNRCHRCKRDDLCLYSLDSILLHPDITLGKKLYFWSHIQWFKGQMHSINYIGVAIEMCVCGIKHRNHKGYVLSASKHRQHQAQSRFFYGKKRGTNESLKPQTRHELAYRLACSV